MLEPEFLPDKIRSAILALNYHLLYEIRLRADAPIIICYAGEFAFLGKNGRVRNADSALKTTAKEIEDVLFAASEYSVYSVSNEMKELFVTAKKGIRIGIAGTVVYDGEKIHAIREITSLCIRIPHAVNGCSDDIFRCCEEDKLRNCIILSPPGIGKTTILRDLIRKIHKKYPLKNILISDERGEISLEAESGLDVLRFCQKKDAVSYGIRSLRPDIFVTDELQQADYPAVERAIECGLKVIATAHFGKDVKAYSHPIFERYVLLGNEIGGKTEIYDERQEKIT